jgi:hypothetical protein
MLTNGAVLIHFAAIELVEGVVPFDPGMSLKKKTTSAPGTSRMFRGAQNVLEPRF